MFVGPSGCEKSTLPRMIAGLERISAGDLMIDGVRANDIDPSARGLAMVFQSYAAYPHMSVAENRRLRTEGRWGAAAGAGAQGEGGGRRIRNCWWLLAAACALRRIDNARPRESVAVCENVHLKSLKA